MHDSGEGGGEGGGKGVFLQISGFSLIYIDVNNVSNC